MQKREQCNTAKKEAPDNGMIAEQRRGPMFKVGDRAVYPAHGVGVIDAIEDRKSVV